MSLLDRALRLAETRAAAPGAIRYTERQLYYELCRVLRPLHAAPRRPGFTLPAPIRYERFGAALARRARPAGRITATAPHRNPDPPADLFDYGFPRLLVCQDAAVAAMLLANESHLESACPVYHLGDLPPDPRLVGALRDGAATVHVLHDASAAGLAAVGRVRQAFEGIPVNALGLRPAHAAALHLTAVRQPPAPALAPAPADDDLLPWERRWLRSGRVVEVASVNPARLLRTVHRLVRGQSRPRPRPSLREFRAAGFMTWPEGAA